MTRVLLVDDEPLVLIGMQGMLNWAALGYEVVGTARNGAEALRAVQEKQPDIVVSDIRMPVMDGFALAEACHKDGSALPAFIMLTSYEEFDYVKRSMRLGVVDYLVKIDLTADSLTLRDETDYPGTVALTLMSVEKPAVDGDTVAFGALAAAAVTGADKIVTEAVPIADPRLRQAWPDTLYRTRIYFTQQLSLVIG